MENNEHPPQPEKVIYVPMAQSMENFQEDDEIDLLELWAILWRGNWFIMGFALACTLVAVYMTLFVMPVMYKSNTVLLPNKSDSGASRLSGLVGSLPIPLNLPGGGGEVDKVGSFLNSRTLKTRLIEKYDLLPRYYPDMWDSSTQQWKVEDPAARPTLVKALQTGLIDGYLSVNNDDKTGLITLSWEDESPEFASLMLERVIAELRFFLDHEYETDAVRERRFVEDQLTEATRELEYWEKQVPSGELSLAKIQRERLATQTVYTELRKQLELAKITEAKELINFKVLDPPFVPENRSSPARTKICLLTIIASGMFSVFLVFAYNFIANARKNKKDQPPTP
jgi:uncharacterized protein involved in exopolysaccharide biosynthesis